MLRTLCFYTFDDQEPQLFPILVRYISFTAYIESRANLERWSNVGTGYGKGKMVVPADKYFAYPLINCIKLFLRPSNLVQI